MPNQQISEVEPDDDARTTLYRLDAANHLLATAGTDSAMQTVNLHDGTIRVRTPFGTVEVSIDHEPQQVAEGVEMGACAVVRIMAALPTTVVASQSLRSLFLHIENDLAEPDAGAADVLHAPLTRADHKLSDVGGRLSTILNHRASPAVVQDEAVRALEEIHDGTDRLFEVGSSRVAPHHTA